MRSKKIKINSTHSESDLDRDNLTGKLQLLIGSDPNNTFDEDKWIFIDQSSNNDTKITLDFRVFGSKYFCFFDEVNTQSTIITPQMLAKLVFLFHSEGKTSVNNFKNFFNFLLKTFAYLKQSQQVIVTHSKFEDYFEFLMMNDVNIDGITRRYTPLAHATVFTMFNFEFICRTVNLLGLGGFLLESTSKPFRENVLKKLIPVLADGLTLTDYKAGGSFNFLTLDIGRYYVEYLADFFDKNYLVAIAIKQTQSDTVKVLKQVGLSKGNEIGKVTINKVLSGHNLNKILTSSRDSKRNAFKISPNKVKNIFHLTLKTFQQNYKSAYAAHTLRYGRGIALLANELHLVDSPDVKELLLSLMYINDQEDSLLSLSSVLNDFSLTEKISVDEFHSACDRVLLKLSKKVSVPNITSLFYKKLGIERSSSLFEVQVFLRAVQAAGTTYFVSLTSWRESEYGFSLKNILVTRNRDILDGVYHPLRFHVNWVVPKTNGEIKLDREIIFPAYGVAKRLHQLVTHNDSDPCLYSVNNSMKDPTVSGNTIDTRVSKLWSNFVIHYQGFSDLRQLDRLLHHTDSYHVLTDQEKECLKLLIEKYPDNHQTKQLRYVMDKVTAELSRIEATKKVRSKDVFSYLTQNMSEEKAAIWNKFLTQETKRYLHEELKISSEDDITRSLCVLIFNEIRSNCAYPTPHAFRHIWAEAVLRRFSGDVGWFIRSNFKHITPGMFMNYLRNKMNKPLVEMAKRQVIHSLIRNHILSRGSKGHCYSGQMEKYLQRVTSNIVVTTLDELDKQIEEYATLEIEDIKSNSWGYCLLKRRNKHRTKCAIEGEPQRQNSSPDLCLGCMNNYIEKGHIKGIMISIENHVNSLKNQHTPKAFKALAVRTVTNAIKVLQTMDKNSNNSDNAKYINHLQSALAANEAS